MWNEKPIHNAVIHKQHLYDLQNCVIQLLPKTLPLKKTWGKKYPICLEAKLLPLHVYPGSSMEIGEEVTLNVDAHFPGDTSVPEEEDRVTEEDEDDEDEMEDLQRMEEDEVEARVKEKLASSSFGLLGQMDLDDEEEFQSEAESGSGNQETVRLYLFARTSRQKEVWFRRLVRARKYPEADDDRLMEEYWSSMKELMSLLPRGHPEEVSDQSVLYSGLNAVIHRVCFDLRQNPNIKEKMERIIQKRLDAIKLPSVMEKFELAELDLGSRVPFIKHINQPQINEQGLWVDMQISFKGTVVSKVKTRINLTQAVEHHDDDQDSSDTIEPSEPVENSTKNSELPGPSQIPSTSTSPRNSETLTDNEQEAIPAKPHVHFYGTSRQQKILRFIETFTRSKMFQRLSDSRVLHRAVANLANTDIIMNVQVQSGDGILTLNIPPPGTNRLWYGFRGVPKMRLKVQPWLGDSRLTNRLLRRIIHSSVRKAVHRMVVLPNMIEITLPFLVPPDYDATHYGTGSHFVSGLEEESLIDSRRRDHEKHERRRSVTFEDENPASKKRGSIVKNPDS